jgi:hypothetical protein
VFQRVRTRARQLRRVALTLICGLLLTIASAWLAAAFSDTTQGKLHSLEHEPAVAIPAYIGAPQDWHLRTWHECWGPGLRYDLVSECEWMGSTLGMSEHTAPNRTLQRMTTGWPLPAMQWDSSTIANAWIGGVPLADRPAIGGLVARRLPIRPLPLRFLLDSVSFALAIFALVTTVHGLRTARRRRRGLCTHCGYSLSGLPTCPECGSAIPPPGPARKLT